MGSLKDMLNPRSVALIGATEKEKSIGRSVLTNLLRVKDRPLYPVNPKRRTILGIPCFPSIAEVPSQVSLAVIAAPALAVPAIIEECGKTGVAGAIILSSGFRGTDPQGKMLERQIIEVRKKYGIRVIGPNCLGVILPSIGLNATFLSTDPKRGNIALISPALGDAILDWGGTMGVGFSMFASLGSMIDVGYGDLIDFLNYDYETRSIMIYMESVGDARRFISAARAFSLNKPIIALKPGRSEIGARVAAERTGRQIGEDHVYDMVFKRVGVVRVSEMSDLFNMAKVLDSRRLPTGRRLAIVTDAGDVGIIATDTLTGLGGKLAMISAGKTDEPDLYLPERWGRDNPIEIMSDSVTGRYIGTVKACLSDEGVDGVLVIYTPRAAVDAMGLAQALIEISRKAVKPIIVTWIGGDRAAEGRRILLQNNVPAYATPEEAVKTYLYMYGYRRNINLLYETPVEVDHAGAPLKNYLKKAVRDTIIKRRRILGTAHSLDLLKNYQIRTVNTTVVSDGQEILKKAQEFGFPVLFGMRDLRGNGDEVPALLTSEDQVSKTWLETLNRFDRDGSLDREHAEMVLWKKAVPEGYWLKVESRRDPEFRTILVLSEKAGGAFNVSMGLPPLNRTLAKRLLEETKVYAILSDAGGGQGIPTNLEDILISFSNVVIDFAEIDSLALVLSVSPSDVLAQEVKVLLASDYDDSSSYPHLVITPYPSRYVTTWNLPSGTEVLLRPVRPEDEPMSREMFATLSKQTLRDRFFSPPEITHHLLIRSCNIDYDREIAILAEISHEGKRKMIGGARLVMEPDSGKAEFAVLVHDDYQRMGLGAKLIDILIGIGQDKQLDEIYGSVLSGNEKMLGLCKKFGFSVKFASYGVSKVSLPLKGRTRYLS
ncbi:MAG TPA: GNAT family N-acetyltransferase [Syntrophorhabdaceae bacterium]|nr:GNAT family N-acetyltransferase [Syntrophorhabdaceae bacterium]